MANDKLWGKSAHFRKALLGVCVLVLAWTLLTVSLSGQFRPLITERIEESALISLPGNTRPEIKTGQDLGRVADDMRLDHLLLQLRRSPEQEQALEDFLAQLNDARSPLFHQWLTAEQFGNRFGLATSDLETIRIWLESRGFSVNAIYPSRVLIDFTGTAGQVRNAFHTEIHNVVADGSNHIANMSDPKIPAALAPAVAGVVSLNDFMPQPPSAPTPNTRPADVRPPSSKPSTVTL